MYAEKQSVFLFRYISERSSVKLFFKIFILFGASIFFKKRMIYFLHNIRHYSNKTKISDSFVNKLLFNVFDKVVIFSDDQRQYVPSSCKIMGKLSYLPTEFPEKPLNKVDLIKIQEWVSDRQDVVIMVSSYPMKPKEVTTFRNLNNSLVVNPGNEQNYSSPSAIMVNDFVYSDFRFLPKKTIGVTLLDNVSMPSTFWNYIYHSWPVLCLAHTPISSIIEKNGLGLVLRDISELSQKANEITPNYEVYKKNVEVFRQSAIRNISSENEQIWQAIREN